MTEEQIVVYRNKLQNPDYMEKAIDELSEEIACTAVGIRPHFKNKRRIDMEELGNNAGSSSGSKMDEFIDVFAIVEKERREEEERKRPKIKYSFSNKGATGRVRVWFSDDVVSEAGLQAGAHVKLYSNGNDFKFLMEGKEGFELKTQANGTGLSTDFKVPVELLGGFCPDNQPVMDYEIKTGEITFHVEG